VSDFHRRSNSPHSPVYHITKLKPAQRLRGRTLNLGGLWADGNFFHWMMDAIPIAELYRQAFRDWSGLDHILMPDLLTPTTRFIETKLGLPDEKIVRLSYRDHYRCDELLVPSLFMRQNVCLPWITEFHRRTLGHVPGDGTTRLFIGRRGTRMIENHHEIMPLLKSEGFEEASEEIGRLRNQLASATHIIGVHGAAMTNLVYARPGARLLELIPSSNPWPCFRTLAAGVGLDYAAISGKNLWHRRHRYGDNTTANFNVNLTEFRTALAVLLEK